MAELHVQRKRNSYTWLWLLIIIIVAAAGAYYYLHYYHKDNLVVNTKPTSSIQENTNRIFNFEKSII
jgi:hypothetical protein